MISPTEPEKTQKQLTISGDVAAAAAAVAAAAAAAEVMSSA